MLLQAGPLARRSSSTRAPWRARERASPTRRRRGCAARSLALARNREGPRAALPTTTASEYGSSDSESYVNPRARVRARSRASRARGGSTPSRGEAFSSREERIRAEPNAGRGVRRVPARGGGGMTYRPRISTRGGRSGDREAIRALESAPRADRGRSRGARRARGRTRREKITASEEPLANDLGMGGGGPRRTTRVSVRGRTSRRSRAKKASGEGPNRARRVRADEARVAEWPSSPDVGPETPFQRGNLDATPRENRVTRVPE